MNSNANRSDRMDSCQRDSHSFGSISILCKCLKVHGHVPGVQIPADLHDLESEIEHVSVPKGPALEHLDDVVVELLALRPNEPEQKQIQ